MTEIDGQRVRLFAGVFGIFGHGNVTCLPDPVLQQVEHCSDPTLTVNDAFKAVTRYWDRITHPAQILSSLPQAVAAMLDPADCGPAFIALPQDTQELAFDYPEVFFEERLWTIPRPRADRAALAQAAALLKSAKAPLIIGGGGVRYSGAEVAVAVAEFAAARGIPVVETNAGKGGLTHYHPLHCGPIGIIGSASANALAAEADVIVAIGTRLQDFTTGSWTAFAQDARFITINAARYDATKHRALTVVGDALETVTELNASLGDWNAVPALLPRAKALFAAWDALPDAHQVQTYAQVMHQVNLAAGEHDTLISAAGGLPGEVAKGWRVKAPHSFDLEFGFSCMGYEIAAGWDCAMAQSGPGAVGGTPIAMLGDGTYMMMNSDIYSSVLSGHKMIIVVCDNGGYAVISRLQQAKGVPGFNNLLKDSRILNPSAPLHVDFAAHAAAMGAASRYVESLSDLATALESAKTTDRTTVISITTDAYAWVPGDADWDVGVPEVSTREGVREARAHQEEIRAKQRIGV